MSLSVLELRRGSSGPWSQTHQAEDLPSFLSGGAAGVKTPSTSCLVKWGSGHPQQTLVVMIRGDRVKHLAHLYAINATYVILITFLPLLSASLWGDTTPNPGCKDDHLYIRF